MVQILRALIITTDGVIVQDYREDQNSLVVYVVTDIESERRYIADYYTSQGYTSQGYTVKRVNLTYVTKE